MNPTDPRHGIPTVERDGWPGPRPDGLPRSSSAALEAITRIIAQGTDSIGAGYRWQLRLDDDGVWVSTIFHPERPTGAAGRGSSPAAATEQLLRRLGR